MSDNVISRIYNKISYKLSKLKTKFGVFCYVGNDTLLDKMVPASAYYEELKSIGALVRDDDRFSRIVSLCGAKRFFYSDLSGVRSVKFLEKYIFGFLKSFYYGIYALRLDDIKCADIHIDKKQILESSLGDKMAALKAYQLKLMADDSEYDIEIKNMEKSKISFRIFNISKFMLYAESNLHNFNLYFLNPLFIFESIYYLFPELSNYTLIIRDYKTHALCHYENGNLIFNAVIPRDSILENHYVHIVNLGAILYCNFTDDNMGLNDYLSVETLIGESLPRSIEILSLAHLHRKQFLHSFHCKDLYSIRNKVKICLLSLVIAICVSLFSFAFDRYEYYSLLAKQERQYREKLEFALQKKQSYTPMYLRIYSFIKENKRLDFSIKQHYENGKWISP